jgi:hypothetical protein
MDTFGLAKGERKMPLYYFDVIDDRQPGTSDAIGTDLIDRFSVLDEAQSLLANIARDRLPDGLHRTFSVSVRNEEGRVIFTAELSLNGKWH